MRHGGRPARQGRPQVIGDTGRRRGGLFAAHARRRRGDARTLTALLAGAISRQSQNTAGASSKALATGFGEFASAVEAVRAATQFQTRVKELTTADAEDRRIAFRVGINVGDVIVEPHDIFGDDVNIAARLESVAEPGGICISSSAYDQVRGKVAFEFADLGEQSLKNIGRPGPSLCRGPGMDAAQRQRLMVLDLSRFRHLSPTSLPSPCCRSRT